MAHESNTLTPGVSRVRILHEHVKRVTCSWHPPLLVKSAKDTLCSCRTYISVVLPLPCRLSLVFLSADGIVSINMCYIFIHVFVNPFVLRRVLCRCLGLRRPRRPGAEEEVRPRRRPGSKQKGDDSRRDPELCTPCPVCSPCPLCASCPASCSDSCSCSNTFSPSSAPCSSSTSTSERAPTSTPAGTPASPPARNASAGARRVGRRARALARRWLRLRSGLGESFINSRDASCQYITAVWWRCGKSEGRATYSMTALRICGGLRIFIPCCVIV